MSVPPECSLVILESGRQPIGVDQPPGGGDDYPLVRPSNDIAGLLADFYLVYHAAPTAFRPPFRIAWLYGFGCYPVNIPVSTAHAHDLVVMDAEDNVVFDSRQATDYQTTDWTERLRVVRWTTATSVAAAAYHTSNSTEDPYRVYPVYLQPQRAVLDERSVRVAARSLRRICVGDLFNCVEGDEVVLRAGYNVRLKPADLPAPFGRKRTAIVIHVVPGEGLGRFPVDCTEQPQAILRLFGVAPDAQGRFRLQPDSCFRLERPVDSVIDGKVILKENALALTDDCLPCATCDDYVAVYEAIRRLRNRLDQLNTRRLALRDRYIANLKRLVESAQCRSRDRLRIIVEGECPNRVGVALGYCHGETHTLTGLRLTVSFAGSSVEGTPTVLKNSVYRSGNVERQSGAYTGRHRPRLIPYPIQGSWPTYWADFDCVEPGTMASLTFRLQLPTPSSPYVAQIVATGSANVAGQSDVNAQVAVNVSSTDSCE